MKSQFKLLKILLVIIAIIVFFFPVLYMILLSFNIKEGFGTRYGLDNWGKIFLPYWFNAVQNSFVIVIFSVIVNLLISFPSAYVFSRYRFMGDKHIFFFLLWNRMIPSSVLLLPYLIMFLNIGLYNTIIGVIFAYFSFNLPMSIWLFTSFMKNIPNEIDEQARVDGYNLYNYFKKILIPLCRPFILIVCFFIWLQTWNEMFIASVLTRYEIMPLNARLFMLCDRLGQFGDIGLACTIGVITILPGLVLLYWARTFLAKGFTFGRV
ncbi:MAG: carbohydrate ABC transporter permease [Nitrososphaeria archaeon]